MGAKSFMVVDIGNKNIKIVSGVAKNDKAVVKEYEIIPTPQNSVKDGRLLNVNAIIDAIRPFQTIHKDKWIILTIGGTSIITREIMVPKSSDPEIEKILEFEAQQYFPVDLGHYSYDYKVAEEVLLDGVAMYRVMLVAVPIRQVEEYMKIPDAMQMEVESIDIASSGVQKCICNMISDKDELFPKEFAVLDLGADICEVFIFMNKKLKFSRMLINGSTNIDNMILNTFNMDIIAAEDYKKTKGVIYLEESLPDVPDEEMYLSTLIKSSIDMIVNEVGRFFDFYISREGSEKIEKIFLTGGGSRIKGIEAFLSFSFGIPVEYIDNFTKVEYKGKKAKEQFDDDRLQLMTALGCLVRGS